MESGQFSPAPASAAVLASPAPPLEPGERVVEQADGVVLGWQRRTILIWWVPGLILVALAWVEFRSLVVTLGLALFCGLLFLFYANDKEVRPRGSRKHYVLTERRLLIGAAGPSGGWRPVVLSDVAGTSMEEGLMDRVVARLSGAATIVLELRTPGPKGEPRRVRIGPMRQPELFRRAIDLQLSPLRSGALSS